MNNFGYWQVPRFCAALVCESPGSKAQRPRAIACALWYGLLPSRFYEAEPHYAPMSYFAHLRMNLAYASRWATWRETDSDIQFETEVNSDASSE